MKKKYVRKAKKAATAKPRRKAVKKVMNVSDKASCSVVRTLDPETLVTNQMFSYDNFALVDYARAVAIARNYQRFRMTGIKLTWKPTFDTYSAAGAGWKPNLYYMIDKNGSIPDNVTLEGLKQMGARPRAFDEKPISVTFKPAVLGESRINAGIPQAAQYVVSPWLATAQNPTAPGAWNPSDVSHQGIKWFIEQGGVPNSKFFAEIEIQFEFTKPLFPTLSAVPSTGLKFAVADNSPDGIVGGPDGLSITLPIEG